MTTGTVEIADRLRGMEPAQRLDVAARLMRASEREPDKDRALSMLGIARAVIVLCVDDIDAILTIERLRRAGATSPEATVSKGGHG